MLIDKLTKINRSIFGNELPDLNEIEHRTALAMVNIHPAIDSSIPLPPNVIPIAGLHIKEAKELPEYIETFINDAKKGVIVFALGSNIRSELMPADRFQSFVDVFQQFPDYHFLWKFQNDSKLTANLPKNVFVSSWLPQSDILNHSKTKAFMTHAGLLSTQEAVWYGVPMICIPLAFDQHNVSTF